LSLGKVLETYKFLVYGCFFLSFLPIKKEKLLPLIMFFIDAENISKIEWTPEWNSEHVAAPELID
jgi:hypothetical protein